MLHVQCCVQLRTECFSNTSRVQVCASARTTGVHFSHSVLLTINNKILSKFLPEFETSHALFECTAAVVTPRTPNRTLARPRSHKPFHELGGRKHVQTTDHMRANRHRRHEMWRQVGARTLHNRGANRDFVEGQNDNNNCVK